MSAQLTNLAQIVELRDRGAIFFVSHSGGKDSQAMFALVRSVVPLSQIVVVHADLGRVEWEGVKSHILSTIDGAEFHVALPLDRDGNVKDLISTIEKRHQNLAAKRAETGKRISPFPSPSQRWCTSDFKRGPLEREQRRIMAEKGATLAVCCMGLRADESDKRECGLDKAAFAATGTAVTLAKHEDLSKAGREVYTWLPIHSLTTAEVFAAIAAAGQKPHAAYAAGMSRLSCCFCIMGSKADMKKAAELNPKLYAEYVRLERETGYTMQSKRTLEETTGIKA